MTLCSVNAGTQNSPASDAERDLSRESRAEESARQGLSLWRISLSATVRDHEPLQVVPDELLDQGRAVEPEHCRMDGQTLRSFEGEVDSRLHLVSGLRLSRLYG